MKKLILALAFAAAASANGQVQGSGDAVGTAVAKDVPAQFETVKAKAELFANIGGKIYGIAFDDRGYMYVVKNGNEIMKVSPEGKISSLCKLHGEYCWSLTRGADGNLYAPAGDRVLKITPEGTVSDVINDPEVKPMSMEFDKEGNMYIASESKVFKFTPRLEKSLFVDCRGSLIQGIGLGGLAFDADFTTLYIADYSEKKLFRLAIHSDGTAGEKEIIFDSLWLKKKIGESRPGWLPIYENARATWFAVDDKGNVFVSLEEIHSILKIGMDKSYSIAELEAPFFISTIAFGGKGFDGDILYCTGYKDGMVHQVRLERKQNL